MALSNEALQLDLFKSWENWVNELCQCFSTFMLFQLTEPLMFRIMKQLHELNIPYKHKVCYKTGASNLTPFDFIWMIFLS